MLTKPQDPDGIEAVRPMRMCPSCRCESEIKDELLWPIDWVCPACGKNLPQSTDGLNMLAPELDGEDVGFRHENFAMLAEIEAGNFWFISRNELIAWLAGHYCADARRVLEIGCGTGYTLYALLAALPKARIAGSELHSEGLKNAKDRHGVAVEFFQMDARNSGLVNALDVVGAFDVLEHIPEDTDVLVEIARMLQPNGILLATVPQHPWMWSTSDELALHQRRYRVGELAAKAQAVGFDILYQGSFITLAFPMMMLARLSERKSSNKRTLVDLCAQQFKLSKSSNMVLLWLCRLEHILRKAGFPLPFGGSQVIVARWPENRL